ISPPTGALPARRRLPRTRAGPPGSSPTAPGPCRPTGCPAPETRTLPPCLAHLPDEFRGKTPPSWRCQVAASLGATRGLFRTARERHENAYRLDCAVSELVALHRPHSGLDFPLATGSRYALGSSERILRGPSDGDAAHKRVAEPDRCRLGKTRGN